MQIVNVESSVPCKHHVQKVKYALEELAFRDVEPTTIVQIMKIVETKSVKMFAKTRIVAVKMPFVKQLIDERFVYVPMDIREILE